VATGRQSEQIGERPYEGSRQASAFADVVRDPPSNPADVCRAPFLTSGSALAECFAAMLTVGELSRPRRWTGIQMPLKRRYRPFAQIAPGPASSGPIRLWSHKHGTSTNDSEDASASAHPRSAAPEVRLRRRRHTPRRRRQRARRGPTRASPPYVRQGRGISRRLSRAADQSRLWGYSPRPAGGRR